jgi:hypothetical protein
VPASSRANSPPSKDNTVVNDESNILRDAPPVQDDGSNVLR